MEIYSTNNRRNISTCVEQTRCVLDVRDVREKHLHMRGANKSAQDLRPAAVETSPHAWSKLSLCRNLHFVNGNISTCVEQAGEL